MGTLSNFMPNVPAEIVNAIDSEFQALESRFSKHDWGPAELNGARFAEAIMRYLEWKQSGRAFTPIGIQLNRQSIVNHVSNDGSLPEGLRFHVLKCSELLLDIRNKRNVAHLGNLLNVDEMDSKLVMRLVKWILAEIIREEYAVNPKEIQGIIDSLSVKEIPLIEEIDGDLVIVGTELKTDQRALIVLYHSYPKPIPINTLRFVTKYKNSTRFRDEIIEEKIKEGLVHLKHENVYLTAKGCAWVEKYVNMHLEI
jgi:hypothetical protein